MLKEFCRICTGPTVLLDISRPTCSEAFMTACSFRLSSTTSEASMKPLAAGRILEITHWLNREGCRRYGGLRLPKDVLREVCHEELSAQPLLTHLPREIYKAVSIKISGLRMSALLFVALRELLRSKAFKNVKAFLNADKHSPASSARSTKRRVRGMLMSVGVESSH